MSKQQVPPSACLRTSRSITLITAAAVLALLIFVAPTWQAHAQGTMSLSTVYADNGQDGISFEITATRSVRLYRFWSAMNTSSQTVEVYYNPNGLKDASGNPITSGWISLGQATVTGLGQNTYAEIPVDLNLLMNPNDTYGFILYTSNGIDYRSGMSPYIFSDAYLSIDTECWGIDDGYPFSSGDFAFYPRQFCGKVTYDEGMTGPNDAGIASIDSPRDFCAGTQDVTVTLRNYGTNQLTSATVNWTINGVPQTAYNWTGLLDTTSDVARETQITLGSESFLANTPYTIAVWTGMPNGVADTINTNDTASIIARAAIAGTFTIGGASPDYATFTDAVNDLNSYGLCGPAVFNVRPGTYNEQIVLEAIDGSSAANTVTFRSETGNAADVTLTYNATSSGSNYVVRLTGASFIIFEDFTVTATGSSYAHAVEIESNSTDNTLQRLVLQGVTTTSSSDNRAVVYSPSGSLNHRTVIRDCELRDGSYGMYLRGTSTSSLEEDVEITNCEFTGQYYRPFYSYYLGRLKFHDNVVDFQSSYSGAYFAYIYNNADVSVERNVFFSDGGRTRYGVYFGSTDGNDNRFVNNFVIVINNGSNTTRGFYINGAANTLVAHNTIYINNGSSSGGRCIYQTGGSNHTYYNNILINDGPGYSMYASTPSAIVESDYNVLYSAGNEIAYWSGARTDLTDLQTASGMDANSISKRVNFADALSGDLHLSGDSENDTDLFGTLLKDVTDDIDGDRRVNPYRGADEACYVTPGSLTYAFVDGAGMPTAYAETPGTIGISYGVSFPEYASTVTLSVQFFDPVSNQLVYETSFSASKQHGVALSGTQYIAVPASVPPGSYRIEVVFNTKNSCDVYRDYMPYASALLIVPEGRTPCVVWPGDANNDGIVNYADRRTLNRYMYDANMRTSWLNGPTRYQPDVETNPDTYLEWKPQAAAPWQTADGCYMDTDANGTVNNMDYLAMKLNWSKSTPWHAGSSKADAPVGAATFLMDQNYPNPFNPSTVIRYNLSETSNVRLMVTDAMGRRVAELENGRLEKGAHETTFDGSRLSSGTYIATIIVTGIESGMTFTKTIKMALSK